MRRSVGRRDISQKNTEQIVIHTFVFVEQSYVIKITWVLSVKRRMQFASIQVFKREDLRFGEAENFLNGICNLEQSGW